MKMPPFAYHRPETIAEAVSLLSEYGSEAKILAGGQSLLPVMALRLGQPDHLIDISRIHELDILEMADGKLRVGATVTHARVEDHWLVASEVPLVAAAMPWIGHRAIRNRGTVCGSLAHADPAAELPAVALALDATFVVRSIRGERLIAAHDFFHGFLTTALTPDEMLCEVRFPSTSPWAMCMVNEVARRHGDYAMVGLAAIVEQSGAGTVEHASLSYFAVGSTPIRARTAEAALRGQPLNATSITEAVRAVKAELDPPADNHASSAYRRHVSGVVLERTLRSFAAQRGVQGAVA
jgi:aerobic carbon-monoxide dehydrogenase medium subunit